MDSNPPPPPPSPSQPALEPIGDAKTQAAQRIKEAANVLVTVSNNPSVDQLSAAVGLTILLNKLGKHAAAVFSGAVPSTIEFLQPEKTLETTTDSLRDFIIALDKSKADKLRYKVEDKVVKIFITPYRTSISEKDLEFSQGDFNVDAVVALGVHAREDLDQAITAHGRILHDATVISINNQQTSDLGSINWFEPAASSLSEMLVEISDTIGGTLDGQIATALLTGIVAETERFSNERTTPRTMSASAKLMSAGANQQLVATQLEESSAPENGDTPPPSDQQTPPPDKPNQPPPVAPDTPPENDDGTMVIDHDKPTGETDASSTPDSEAEPGPADEIDIDREGILHRVEEERKRAAEATKDQAASEPSKLVTEPPSMGGTLTANSRPEDQNLSPSTDPLSLPPVDSPLLNHDDSTSSSPPSSAPSQSATSLGQPISELPAAQPPASVDQDEETLSQLEAEVDSPHSTQQLSVLDEDAARQAANQAASAAELQRLEPIRALGAQPVNLDFGHNSQFPASSINTPTASTLPNEPANSSDSVSPQTLTDSDESSTNDPPAAAMPSTVPPLGPPPPVPPPLPSASPSQL